MDYIDGCDLDSYLSEQKNFIPADEIMRFAREIGGALAYCHEDCFEFLYNKEQVYEYRLESALKGQKFTIAPDPENAKKDLITELQRRELIREYGITHNDLHSKNIMRRKYDGSYILLDFGLAIQDGKAVKSSSRRDGAVEYKAPEKWEKNSDISPRSDIYSFGVILYEMLAGHVPFVFERDKYSREEQALFELSIKHEKEQPPAIEPLRRAAYAVAYPGNTYIKDFPDWLEQMIMKCLAKRPEDRYTNAKEFIVEFEKNLEESQIENNRQTQKLKSTNEKMQRELRNLSSEKAALIEQIDTLKDVIKKQKPDPSLETRISKCGTPDAGNRNVINNVTISEPEMVFVQGGTFTMGCTSEQGSDCENDEKPAHQVTVSSFRIGKYPVTQAQWKAVMGSYPSELYNTGCDDCPIESVNWDDIQEFIKKLNVQTGNTYRLPTEAEWEFACRGGLKSAHYKYSGSNILDEVAWYDGNYKNSKHGSQGTTHPVGKKKPNELGIYDMSGNVFEWCSDWYGIYTNSAQTNPKIPSSGSYRVLRGGSWGDGARYCRVSYRDYNSPGGRNADCGFRLASKKSFEVFS